MFGYIIVNKMELRFREFDIYRSYYCGLCKALKKSGGNLSRMSLSYDMTFVYMLLSSLYEPTETIQKENCILHPKKKPVTVTNEYAEYIADMSVAMTYYKAKDDWKDEKKLLAAATKKAIEGRYRQIELRYSEKLKKIKTLMEALDEGEISNNYDIDYMSGLFGAVMAEIFVYRQDIWEENLRKIGFYLGKFIYLMDAYEDIEEDKKTSNYNPFTKLYEEDDYEKRASDILVMMMGECTREFEKLPILKNVEILRNILYSGVWARKNHMEKNKEEKKANGKSL